MRGSQAPRAAVSPSDESDESETPSENASVPRSA